MRTFLVVNPKSASGETGRRWPEIHAEVLRTLGEADHAFTERPMHAAELTATALRDGYRRIVAIGGDGTVNEVVNGFFRHPGGVPPDARLALIPRGTGGDFRRTFGLEGGLREACSRLSTSREGSASGPSTWDGSATPPPTEAVASATSSTSPASGSVAGWTGRSTPPPRCWGGRPASSSPA